jgi:hypothetical protein
MATSRRSRRNPTGTPKCGKATQGGAGPPCKNFPIVGGTVCPTHGGAAPQVRAKAAARYEVMKWGLGGLDTDPGETLLRLVAQSSIRAQRYAEELAEHIAEKPSLRDALVGEAWGEGGKTGEFVRGLAQLESAERDRCANFCRLAIAAGLAERQVRLAERQGQLMTVLLRSVLADPTLGLSPAQRGAIPGMIRRHLELAK